MASLASTRDAPLRAGIAGTLLQRSMILARVETSFGIFLITPQEIP
jgi:hypothetical protein